MNRVRSFGGPTIKYDVEDSHLVEINKSGLAYNPSWLYEKVTEGVLSENNILEILSMADILEAGFPGLWDIQVGNMQYLYSIEYQNDGGYGLNQFTQKRTINRLYFKIILRFPEITIKNSKRGSHVIRDLYVMIRYKPDITTSTIIYSISDGESKLVEHPQLITYDGLYANFDGYSLTGNQLCGLRETVSIFERDSGYSHSHLGSSLFGSYTLKWTNFCLGSGEIIPTMTALSNQYTANLFTLFLYQVDAYVRWESIEGTPYISIAAINQGGKLTQLPIASENTQIRYLSRIIRKIDSLQGDLLDDIFGSVPPEIELDWRIEEGQLRLVDNQKFDDFVKISPTPSSYDINTIFYQDDEGTYYSRESSQIPRIPSIPDITFLFRGEDRTFKIYVPERVELKPNFVLHPAIKQYIKFKLESHANYARIKSSISNRANQIAHSSRGLRQNTAHM